MKNPAPAKGLIIAFLIVICDQATKYYLLNILNLQTGDSIKLLPFFNLALVWNKGISFGMGNSFPHSGMIFSSVAIIIVLLLMSWLYKAVETLPAIALGLIIGGAVGNIIDRLRLGAVTDFLDLYIGRYHWPAFNIGDSAVCIGAVLLAVYGLSGNKEIKAN